MTPNEHHQLGIQLFEAKQFAAALCEFNEVVRKQETSEAWNDWATSQLACGKTQEAEHGYRRAVELDSHSTVAVTNLAVFLTRVGRPIEALPYLELVAANLDESKRQVLLSLVETIRASAQDRGPATVGEFMAALRRLSNIDDQMPDFIKDALSRRAFDSRSCVKAGLQMVRKLPEPLRPRAVEELEKASACDYRFGLIAALYHLEAGDPRLAVPFVRAAGEKNSDDLYAEELLIEAELAIARSEGKSHPTFSGLDEYLAGSFCERPWQHFELASTGNVYMCCPGWLPAPIGEITKESAFKIWNSGMAQEIRRSVLDGSFKYCSKLHCPFIAARTLPKRTPQDGLADSPQDAATISEPPAPLLTTKTGPLKIVLTYDRSCNLACPSCRSDFILADKTEQDEIDRIQNQLLAEAFDDAQSLFLDGAGELFVSKPSRSILKALRRERYPNLKFTLITNGQLFNPRSFEEFDFQGRIHQLNISMDAATEPTYRVVRRGGDFSRLLSNLAYIDELRQQKGERFILSLFFVVWARNFREMAEFVQLGKRFHADTVQFSLIRNLGHLSGKQFDEMNVADPGHPDHGEFIEMLKAPELDDVTVDLGSVSQFRPQTSPKGASGA